MEQIFRFLEEGSIGPLSTEETREKNKRTNIECKRLLNSQEFVTLPTEVVQEALMMMAKAGLATAEECFEESLALIGSAFTLLKEAVLETKESDAV